LFGDIPIVLHDACLGYDFNTCHWYGKKKTSRCVERVLYEVRSFRRRRVILTAILTEYNEVGWIFSEGFWKHEMREEQWAIVILTK